MTIFLSVTIFITTKSSFYLRLTLLNYFEVCHFDWELLVYSTLTTTVGSTMRLFYPPEPDLFFKQTSEYFFFGHEKWVIFLPPIGRSLMVGTHLLPQAESTPYKSVTFICALWCVSRVNLASCINTTDHHNITETGCI